MSRVIDLRVRLADDLIAFLDQEAQQYHTSGRAGYVGLLIGAMAAARRGDTSLIAVLIGADAPQTTTPAAPVSGNEGAIDAGLPEMFP